MAILIILPLIFGLPVVVFEVAIVFVFPFIVVFAVGVFVAVLSVALVVAAVELFGGLIAG